MSCISVKRLAAVFLVTVVTLSVTPAKSTAAPVRSMRSSLTRAEAVALLVESDIQNRPRLEFLAKHMPPMPLFADLDQKAWYSPYIEVAFERGWIRGGDDGLFRPRALLTQEEATIIAANLRGPHTVIFPTVDTVLHMELLASLQVVRQQKLEVPVPFHPFSPISERQFRRLVATALSVLADTVVLHLPDRTAPGLPRSPTFVASVPTNATPPISESHTPIVGANPVSLSQSTNISNPQPSSPTPHSPSTPYVPALPPSSQQTVLPAQTVLPVPTQNFSISLPTLGVSNLTVTHPSDSTTQKGLLAVLQQGVGHLFSYPGQGGKILIYGHSSGYSWDVSKYTKIFRQINKLSVGDQVILSYNGRLYTYTVNYKETVDAADNRPYTQGESEELVLYTCWPPDSIRQRYLVHAVPVTTTAMR